MVVDSFLLRRKRSPRPINTSISSPISRRNIPTDVRARHYSASGSPTDRSEVAVSPQYDPSQYSFFSTVFAVTPVSNGFRVLYGVPQNDDNPNQGMKFFRHRIDPGGVPVPGASRPVGASNTLWVSPGPGDVLFAGRYDASQHRLSMQKVDSSGKPAGTVYILNTRPFVLDTDSDFGLGGAPVIKPLSDGGWVAVFGGTSLAAPGSPARQVIRARRFNAAGVPLGPDFDVNSIPAGARRSAPFLGTNDFLVASGPAGRFAVAWDFGRPFDLTIRVRYFNAAGVPTAPETVVAQEEDLASLVSMAFDGTGRIFLAWLNDANFEPGYPTTVLRARLVGANGAPVGPAFGVQTAVSRDYDFPFCGSVVWAGDSWLITWLGFYLEDNTAIFVRRYR